MTKKRQRMARVVEEKAILKKNLISSDDLDSGKKQPAKFPGNSFIEEEKEDPVFIEQDIVEKLVKPFGSPGGKDKWVKLLISKMPEHKVYVEPYAGSASVFFAKEPSVKEVLSDLNKDIMFVYRFIKNGTEKDFKWMRNQKWVSDKKHFEKLKNSAYTDLNKIAYRYKYLNLFSKRGENSKFYPDYRGKNFGVNFLNNLEKFKERLKNTILLTENAEKVIKKYDSKDTFFYLDPPWKVCASNEEWKNFDHEQFLNMSKNIKGKVLISYQGKLNLDKKWKKSTYIISQGGFNRESTQDVYQNYSIKKKLTKWCNPSNFTDIELYQAHNELHNIYEKVQKGTSTDFSISDVVNIHSRVVDELFEKNYKHVIKEKDDLDDNSTSFELYLDKQTSISDLQSFSVLEKKLNVQTDKD